MFMLLSIMQEAKISPLRKRNVMNGKKGVGMPRSCQNFSRLIMHTTLILMLEEYMFKELNYLKWNHIYLHVIQKGFRKK